MLLLLLLLLPLFWFLNSFCLLEYFAGIEDCVLNAETYREIKSIIKESKTEVSDVIKESQNNQLEPIPGHTIDQTFEIKVNRILHICRERAGSIAWRSLTEHNSYKSLINAGSKGSKINISQVNFIELCCELWDYIPAGNYMFKVNNRNTRAR